ncbi:MAG TPA: hypothetical protein VGG15_01960 [Terriglobales bacterium]|jgi:hypothetical protein
MDDSETEYIVELQPKITDRLNNLGFNDAGNRDLLAHGLAEIASCARTLDQQALPLFLSLDPQHRRALAEVTVALKNHLDAMQDSISDVRASLTALTDFLLREQDTSAVS